MDNLRTLGYQSDGDDRPDYFLEHVLLPLFVDVFCFEEYRLMRRPGKQNEFFLLSLCKKQICMDWPAE
jgi:hypothetical protein